MKPSVRRRIVRRFFLASIVAVLFLPTGVASAWTTNLIQLDNGTCGTNLQIGSNKAASSSSTPTFWIMGDGGLSSYAASIDGKSIGTFAANMYSNVCVRAASALADGSHGLTVSELAPHPQSLAPFSFLVDTVAPSVPSTPTLAPWSQTGGSNVSSYHNVALLGHADPNMSLSVSAKTSTTGPLLIGGALSDANGSWTVSTTYLADGTYSVTAAAIDEAGNNSPVSGALTLTIGTQAQTQTTPAAPTGVSIAAVAPNGIWIWWNTPPSGAAPIQYYLIYRGSTRGGETPYAFTGTYPLWIDPNANLARGHTYFYRIAALNSYGIGTLSPEVFATY